MRFRHDSKESRQQEAGFCSCFNLLLCSFFFLTSFCFNLSYSPFSLWFQSFIRNIFARRERNGRKSNKGSLDFPGECYDIFLFQWNTCYTSMLCSRKQAEDLLVIEEIHTEIILFVIRIICLSHFLESWCITFPSSGTFVSSLSLFEKIFIYFLSRKDIYWEEAKGTIQFAQKIENIFMSIYKQEWHMLPYKVSVTSQNEIEYEKISLLECQIYRKKLWIKLIQVVWVLSFFFF